MSSSIDLLLNFSLIIVILFPISVSGDKNSSMLKMEGRIVGGDYVDALDFPHVTFLWIACNKQFYMCGASVVNQVVLVTAAHCIHCTRSYTVEAFAGDEDLDGSPVQSFAKAARIHGGYIPDKMANDIALLLLAKQLPLGDNIKRVIIKQHHSEAAVAIVAGWGVVDDYTKEKTRLLKMVDVSLRSKAYCQKYFNLSPGMLCAGSAMSNNRPSSGDSGSGLVSDYELIGLVSFRNDAYPGLVVYTDVSHFYRWIKRSTAEMYCSS